MRAPVELNGRIRAGPTGRAAVHEFKAFAMRILGREPTTDEAFDLVARFIRAVDPREKERVENGLRRELGSPRLSFPERRA
jgi:hypothetical protein